LDFLLRTLKCQLYKEEDCELTIDEYLSLKEVENIDKRLKIHENNIQKIKRNLNLDIKEYENEKELLDNKSNKIYTDLGKIYNDIFDLYLSENQNPHKYSVDYDEFNELLNIIEAMNINISGYKKINEEKLSQTRILSKKIQDLDDKIIKKKYILDTLNLNMSQQTKGLFGSIIDKDIDLIQDVLEVEDIDDKIKYLMLNLAIYLEYSDIINILINYITPDNEMFKKIAPYLDYDSINKYNLLEKLDNKYMFEYFPKHIDILETQNEEIKKFKKEYLKKLSCQNDSDFATLENFDEMNLIDLMKIIKIKNNCYHLDSIFDWIKTKDTDPYTNEPLSSETIKTIKNIKKSYK
jgi:hypothetical protein